MIKFLLLFIALQTITIQADTNVSGENSSRVDGFVNIVLQGMRDALNFQLPVNKKTEPTQCSKEIIIYGDFDFIVIGSGAAGSAIANRLSEEETFNVLLLESGQFGNEFIDIPAMSFYAQGSEYNWGYKSVPQKHCCLGMVDQKCLFQRGHGIGGSTLINGLTYSRGSAQDYDRWGALGNDGWSWEEVLPYFKKSEHNTIRDLDDNYHGTDGPINLEYSKYTNPHIEAFLTAHKEIDHPILDYNGREHIGASRAQFNTINGQRDSNGRAYILPILNRTNLDVSTGSFVTKVLINPDTHRAYGVEFAKENCLYHAISNFEVISAAGSIGSTQILHLSGVGPKTHLEKFGIPVISDLSVGDNLQDHISIFGLTIETNTSIETGSVKDYVEDYLQGYGPYTLPGNNAAVAFHKTNFSKYHSADFELLMISPNRSSDYFQKGFGFTQETTNAILENLDNPASFTIYVFTMHPDSVGTIRLNSKNPFDYPLIDPQFLDNDYDMETLYQGILLIGKLLETEAYRKLDARFKPIKLGNCRQYELFSKEYWYCFIRHTSDEIYHPVGTCKMFPDPKNGGVVNNKFEVYGIQGLRVCDASVIPFSMVGHTSAPATMIGERCASFIKDVYLNTTYT